MNGELEQKVKEQGFFRALKELGRQAYDVLFEVPQVPLSGELYSGEPNATGDGWTYVQELYEK